MMKVLPSSRGNKSGTQSVCPDPITVRGASWRLNGHNTRLQFSMLYIIGHGYIIVYHNVKMKAKTHVTRAISPKGSLN